MVECTGMPLDSVIEYMPLPLLWECGGLRFVALRVATLELTGRLTQYRGTNDTLMASAAGIGQRSRYQVHQLVGARNSRPAPEVAKVVGTFVEEINSVRP